MTSYTKIYQKSRNFGSIVHPESCRICIINSRSQGVKYIDMYPKVGGPILESVYEGS